MFGREGGDVLGSTLRTGFQAAADRPNQDVCRVVRCPGKRQGQKDVFRPGLELRLSTDPGLGDERKLGEVWLYGGGGECVGVGVAGVREVSHPGWAWALCRSDQLVLQMQWRGVARCTVADSPSSNSSRDLTKLRVVARRLHIRVELVVVPHREDRPASEAVGHARESLRGGTMALCGSLVGSVGGGMVGDGSRRSGGWVEGGKTC